MNNELTPGDIKKMEDEIEYRVHEVRKKALEDVKEARAQGDLSENFEYYAAKKFKNQNESRIRYLERMLKNAKIVSDQSKSDEVGINNTVTLYMEDDDEEEEEEDEAKEEKSDEAEEESEEEESDDEDED